MGKERFLYFLILIFFTAISIYNLRIRKHSLYNIKVTRLKVFILAAGTLIFFIIGYYIGGNSWDNYILVVSASIFLTSPVISEGIHEKGIYYRHLGSSILILAKWEDIRDIEIDLKNSKVKSFMTKKQRVYVKQDYKLEDIKKIKNYIK